jgi:hypothetical protein
MTSRMLLALLLLAAAGCASGGAETLDFDACELKAVRTETWVVTDQGLDAAYWVRGAAGSPATVWLTAKNPSGSYVSGYGVEVGPGPFEAVVELDLTGKPESLVVVLEVSGKRCKIKAPIS